MKTPEDNVTSERHRQSWVNKVALSVK